MKSVILLFDFIMKFYGDKETTLVKILNNRRIVSYRSEQMSFFKTLIEKENEIRIVDLESKGDIICTSKTFIDYFTFINDKIIIYF